MKNEIAKAEKFEISSPESVDKFSEVLKSYIEKNKLSVEIQGKQYVYCDGWKFAGISFGFTHICKKPENESNESEIKYSCEADIINMNTGQKIGYGWALCSNKELKKKKFDEYAIASMSQTRAIAKAYRNLIGFVMNSAGFEPTPMEEMEEKTYHKQPPNAEIDPSDVFNIIEAIKATKHIEALGEVWKELTKAEQSNPEIILNVKAQNKKLSVI